MAITDRNANYVKFTRGTPRAYEILQEKDPDTLYFISEKDEDTGILYLGTKIIAGGSSGVSVTSLKDLTDVLIGEDIVDGSLLTYDEESNKWVVKTLAQIFELMVPIMVGATADKDGVAGLVPVPLANQHEFVLLGDGTWSSGLKDLTATVNTLIGSDLNMSVREIAEAVIETHVGSLEDFKEIMDWFEEHPDFTDFNRRLIEVEGTLFDQGSIENNNYIPGLQTVVSTMSLQLSDVVQEINNIYERLTWQEIDEETV